MHLEFSVRSGSGPAAATVDVAVDAPATTRVRAVLPELARLAGAGPGDLPWLSGRALIPTATLLDSGLHTGAELWFGPTAPDPPAPTTHVVHVVAGGDAGSTAGLRRGGLVLGRDEECDVVVADDLVSRRHAELRMTPAGPTVSDLGSTNGTTLDGVAVPAGRTVVAPGQLLRLGHTVFGIRGDGDLPRAAVLRTSDGYRRIRREPVVPPRTEIVLPALEVAAVGRPGRTQWVSALLPAAVGVVLAATLGSALFLLMMLLSPVMALGGAAGDRLHWRRERRRAAARVRRDTAGLAARTASALRDETRARRTAHPDAATLADVARLPGRALWSRVRGGHDELTLRIGTTDAEARTRIRGVGDDEARPAGVVPAVPHIVDLRRGALGLVGTDEATAGVARWLMVQLAVLHAPKDLDLVVLCGPGRARSWHWLRWLPHLGARAVIDCARPPELSLLDGSRWPGTPMRDGGLLLTPQPRRVVLADRLRPADADALGALLAHRGDDLTAICLADSDAGLPAGCHTIARAGDGARLVIDGARDAAPTGDTAHRVDIGPGARSEVCVERITRPVAESIARDLAAYRDAGDGPELPRTCRLADLLPALDPSPTYGADPLLEGWRRGGVRVPLGVTREGPLMVDLEVDGPHALVTGTTGSGKSELLRSLVLALCVAASPAETSLLLVDYKGGAAFADLARLPHCTGLLTDLEPALTRRALQSLTAELRRRERVLGAAGAADLATYRAAGHGEPLARLVIVVDEFAELATDRPEFLGGLVGIARRGRSLGVHLVLATQRPGAAVTPEIRANTPLRVTLRVTEPAESLDVIGVPDAALLGAAPPGRGFARVADRLLAFQAARVASHSDTPASDDGGVSVRPLMPWRQVCRAVADDQPGATSDAAARRAVDLLRRAAREAATPRPHLPWLPPLPSRLPLTTVQRRQRGDDAPSEKSELVLGKLDLPEDQAQPWLRLGPTDSSVLVLGRNRSGRTTALATMAIGAASANEPGELDIHLISGTGRLAETVSHLPHVATAAGRDDRDVVPELLVRLAEQRHPDQRRTLLLVDDWDLVLSGVDDATRVRWADLLATVLAASGPRLRIAVTGGRSLLAPAVASLFGLRILLALTDTADYALAGVPSSAVPDPGAAAPPGRGVLLPDGCAVQLAYPHPELEVDDPAGTVPPSDSPPREGHPADGKLRLRALPAAVSVGQVRSTETTAANGLLLGLAGVRALPCRADLITAQARLLVAGPPRSGRSTALLTLAGEALDMGGEVLGWAPPRSPLSHLIDRHTESSSGRPGLRRLDASTVPPRTPTLVLVDDLDRCDGGVADALLAWLHDDAVPVAVVAAARIDDLVNGFQPLVAELRRDRVGILLRPGPLDAELFGRRHPGASPSAPPGRGLFFADPQWCPLAAESPVLPLQVALPEPNTEPNTQPNTEERP